jgi:hypothetical protein
MGQGTLDTSLPGHCYKGGRLYDSYDVNVSR